MCVHMVSAVSVVNCAEASEEEYRSFFQSLQICFMQSDELTNVTL